MTNQMEGKDLKLDHTTVDMRAYKDAIKRTMEDIRKREKSYPVQWGWKIVRLNRFCLDIRWGYLDYLGEIDCFQVYIDETMDAVIGSVPGDTHQIFELIGDAPWECPTWEKAICNVMRSVALYAHNVY